jgi:septal ring factor EnvC (AmiA/AmiB activator)
MADATRAELIGRCEAAEKRARDLAEQRDEMRRANDAAHKDLEQTRKQFADLKERLYGAEMENQRLRGYLQRVQEDDTVREELVVTGDPDGQRAMVPKRKSTVFLRPDDLSRESSLHGQIYSGERQKPKHWISY